MLHLSTFGLNLSCMQANMPYMDPTGKLFVEPLSLDQDISANKGQSKKNATPNLAVWTSTKLQWQETSVLRLLLGRSTPYIGDKLIPNLNDRNPYLLSHFGP